MQEDTTAIKAKGVVKSVQRGKATLSGPGGLGPANKSTNIAISPVNLEKAIIVATIHGNPSGGSSDSAGYSSVVLKDESHITFTLTGSGNCGTVALSWQVVEFY